MGCQQGWRGAKGSRKEVFVLSPAISGLLTVKTLSIERQENEFFPVNQLLVA